MEQPPARERIDVADLANGVAARCVAQPGSTGRRVEVDVPVGTVVEADRLQLERALGNLLENAFRHGDGTVTLRARGDNGVVEFHVTDDGPGFPDEFADRAFERFSSADEARGGEGTGLGLAIVDAVAHAHGGTAGLTRQEHGADVWLPDPGPQSGLVVSSCSHLLRRSVAGVKGREQLTRVRERQAARLYRLKRRIVLASTLCFAGLFGLAAQHAVGSSKHRIAASTRRAPRVVPAKAHFFDEQGAGYAFADPQPAPDLGPAHGESCNRSSAARRANQCLLISPVRRGCLPTASGLWARTFACSPRLAPRRCAPSSRASSPTGKRY